MKAKLIILLSVLITAIPLAFLIFPFLFNTGRTSANTRVLGKDYSYLNRDQIKSRLAVDFQLPQSVNLSYQDRIIPVELASISAQIDYDTTATSLIYKNLNHSFSTYLIQLFKSPDQPLNIIFDPLALDAKIAGISAEIEKPFIPTELQVVKSNNKFIVVSKTGELGLSIDRDKTKAAIINQLSQFDFSQPVSLEITQIGQLPDSSQIESTQAKATKLIGKSLSLIIEDKTSIVDDKTLISWLDFNNSYHTDRIKEYATGLSQSYKRDPVNAVFQFENGKVLEFKPASKGMQVDTDALVAALPTQVENFITIQNNSYNYTIPVIFTDPEIKTEDVNDLGIRDLLGKGTSLFKHSSAIRNMNVEKGASVVNRILVAPGETFSFVKALGEVSLESGYKMAYIIRGGKTELDVGGGICQVSTTFFRAMLNAGLNITARQHHAYRVSYYEEDMPPGYDATVFIPSPDLKFINDTGHHILIQNIYDGKAKTLTYEIYGTSDGRQAEISNYRQWGSTPPPPDQYIDDPTLPPGKIIQLEHRIPGLKTSFDWKVTRNGEVLHQKTFTSNYVPWAAVYRRGPAI